MFLEWEWFNQGSIRMFSPAGHRWRERDAEKEICTDYIELYLLHKILNERQTKRLIANTTQKLVMHMYYFTLVCCTVQTQLAVFFFINKSAW